MTPWWNLGRGTLARDLALAGASFAGGLLMLTFGTYRQLNPALLPQPSWALHGTLALTCVAVALRRVATRRALVLGTVAFLLDLACGSTLATTLVYTQVLFDSCVYGPPRLWRRLLWITLAVTVLSALVGVAFLAPWSWQGVALAVPAMLIGVLPVVGGISLRQYRDQAVAERARAEQTARLAELDQRQAVAAERSRMARELHDVIANHMSAVAIHATAALSVPNLDRSQLDQALRVIRENSVQGLAEMRQMIGLLREPADGRSPPAGTGDAGTGPLGVAADGIVRARLAEADRLVDQARNAGLSVRSETVGPPRALPVAVDLAAYRIVQESLTNALKHGSGQADLVVDYQPRSVGLTVENPVEDAPGARSGPGTAAGLPGAAAGLVGMRERTVLLGGRFHAGRYGTRWRVRVELPTEETPARSGMVEAAAPGPRDGVEPVADDALAIITAPRR
ncbi:sensor histidine kinase [Plantactinospora sp. CA-290183]|uniref:sensor histidine kinase n=1 Tax=Plantactinospora sp. CA-290183 TaxID=3240006 RepID=UPI003D8DC0A4